MSRTNRRQSAVISTLTETPHTLTIRFEVSDTGIGIPLEAQARLFQAFEQSDSSMTRKYGGSGLGLAISKRLVELMGGRIGLNSRPGSGSTFWFDIPFEHQASADEGKVRLPESTPPAPFPPDLTGYHVLLAEDEPINQEVSRCLLELLRCGEAARPARLGSRPPAPPAAAGDAARC